MNAPDEPASPCISVCLLDEDDVCVGCYRSADEVTEWFSATPDEKRSILRRSAARRAAAQPVQWR